MTSQDASSVRDPQRLETLRRLMLLDTPVEEAFDRLTRLARKVLHTPMALFSLVDEDRQFFKSAVGLPEEWAALRETPLSYSFCRHTIPTREPLVVEDARQEPLLRDNAAVRELGMTAYLGVPLITGGQVIGAFCVLDYRPRQWSKEDLDLLRDLAASVTSEVELRAAVRAARREAAERGAAEEALRTSETRYRLVGRATRDVIWDWDLTTDAVEWSDAMGPLLGYPSGDAAGTIRHALDWWSERIHPEDRDAVVRSFEEIIRKGHETWQAEYRFRRADGSYAHVLDRAYIVRDAEHRPVRVLGAMMDITERREAQDALRAARDSFQHLVQNSPFGVYAVDADFRLVQVSAGAQKVFANVRPLLGRDFAEVLRAIWPEPFAAEAIRIFRHTLETGEPYHSPATVERRRDIGQVEAYDWKVERITLPDGRPGAVCHFYDLSERQHYEEVLREADRRKDEFLAMLAHELRNPLGAIRNAVALLERGEPGSPAFQRALEVAQRQVQYQSRIVDDLLDLSRISRGKMELRRDSLDLAALVRDTAEDFRREVERRGLRLSVSVPEASAPVWGDRTRLAQVLGNLLHNAAKFTPPGGKVHVALSLENGAGQTPPDGDAAPPAPGRAVVTVRDTGVGMDPEMLSRLFEPFAQADRTLDRSRGGLGLGLALVKGLVEMHGGAVRGASAGAGTGAEFSVAIPLSVGEPLDLFPAAAPVSPEAPAPLRVLVIEDNPDAADTLRDILELSGFTVEVAYSGPAGLDLAERFTPDVVLCDIGLPGMDGYAVAEELRRRPTTAGADLVAITGYGQEEDRRRAKAAGFHRHLVKPLDPDELNRLLASLARK